MADDGSDFLYGDIDEKHREADLEELQAHCGRLEADNAALQQELADSRAQIEFLVGQKEVLETNMAALFNTATNDLRRKDKQIIELRQHTRR